MDSTHVTISISHLESQVEPKPPSKEEKKEPKALSFVHNIVSHTREKITSNKQDVRKLIHSAKVGIALVLVSLLYLLDPLYDQVGDNAMWAIMTVVVIFEFYAGATLGKGLNRGIGTILGGGLGCLAAYIAQEVGGTGNSIIIAISVFIFGAGATYTRLVPKIKKRHDYGLMIFILTFNLVAVSGLRAEKVLEIARERLSTIGMGFAVCVFISLVVFPTWASDELHDSTASKFQDLAESLQGCMEDYFRLANEKENEPSASSFSSCKSVLNSKAKDELLANFAKWEPWHGKFGLYYPWGKYLKLGELLRELAASLVSLKHCLQSPRQPSTTLRQSIKEQCEEVGCSLAWSLRELGDSIKKMRKCQQAELIAPKVKAMRVELSSAVSANSKLGQTENIDALAVASFVFLLMEVVEKVQVLAKEVEELGELAGFLTSAH
ncbi:Aluminum-activated malate transporter 13 [Morus notabilis]|uniref:Aluminum-activated malate transporter 13 n=1 Tax=Morus notabilis TaxID=981085 RepID=W9R718_9ROSA|nr:aluminum-activated malate transporter 13 [Morus notabilis]EXB39361.1 Aluminum-activated malate transporter 13 [Morus notabilis]